MLNENVGQLFTPGKTGQMSFFSDESRLNLNKIEGTIRVYRRRGKRFSDNCYGESFFEKRNIIDNRIKSLSRMANRTRLH